jgi:dihydrofolate synthase/folylpolyglutamate synthase
MTTDRTLPEWLEYIGSVHPRSIDLGLDRVRRVAQRLGVLPPAPSNLIIAGTNGKGSTSVYAEALLRAAGKRVGTTLSPHLIRFNERIRIDGMPVSDACVVEAFQAVELARADATLTYFEYAILAALSVFKDAGVDVCVLEVGLGGRLDAVNLVDGDVGVITSIGLDHQEYLGDDLESIAREKAGIMRPGVPCVFGATDPPAAIMTRACTLDAPLYVRGRDFDVAAHAGCWSYHAADRQPCSIAPGRVAPANAAAAIQAVALLVGPSSTAELQRLCVAAREAGLPGRFEQRRYRDRQLILDVAHNPHGATFLADQLRQHAGHGRTVAVMGCLKDKDAGGIVAALDSVVDEWVFVDSETARGQTAKATRNKCATSLPATVAGPLAQGLDWACERSTAADRIVVLGSFDVVGRTGALLESLE